MNEKKREHRKMDLDKAPLTMLLGHVDRIHRQYMDAGSLALGLQPGYRRLHMELIHSDGCSQRTLAEKTGLSAPTVSIALGKMENDGLICREVDNSDTRRSKVYLTEKGRALDQSMRSLFSENEERVASALTAKQQAQLRALLAKIITHLEETEASEEK